MIVDLSRRARGGTKRQEVDFTKREGQAQRLKGQSREEAEFSYR